MVFFFEDGRGARPLTRFLKSEDAPGWADLAAFLIIGAIAVLVVHGAGQATAPLSALKTTPVTLDLANLPGYALRTTIRMFAAILCSLLFTFTVATLAAKSKRAALVIVPALDILQSIPVFGFLTFTVTIFLNLFPGSQLGAEGAAIFAVFTAQAWNMTFSFYQSLRTIPTDLEEVSNHFGLSAWGKFRRLELPFAMPGLVWNTMMSMSGGWFFVVISEAITVGDKTITLPGIGSWLALAISQANVGAVAEAVGAMALVILAYDQIVFRPIVAWSDKFRFENTASGARPSSWLYDLFRRTRFLAAATHALGGPFRALANIRLPALPAAARPPVRIDAGTNKAIDRVWLAVVITACAWAVWQLAHFIGLNLSWGDIGKAVGLGFVTLLRVAVLIAVASLIWVPIGVWIGLRPAWAERLQPVAQFLAAFPANVLFPVAVIAIVRFDLNPDVWLSPLIIFGTQWYILFNVIAGASAIPGDMKEVAGIFHVRGWQWWRQIALPAIFPYYVTGALTASGGSWNASIVAEVVSWGKHHIQAHGLGAYIANATTAGDYPRVALGIAVLSIFVIGFNRALWRPMYSFAERRLRIA